MRDNLSCQLLLLLGHTALHLSAWSSQLEQGYSNVGWWGIAKGEGYRTQGACWDVLPPASADNTEHTTQKTFSLKGDLNQFELA